MNQFNMSLQHSMLILAANGWWQRLTARERGIHREPVVGVGGSIYFDNFQLDTSPVPEPQTLALIGMGSLLLGFLKFRKAS